MVRVARVKRDLLAAGFVIVHRPSRSKGDHGYIYVHPDGRSTTLKEYRNGVVPDGTLSAIRKQTGLTFR